MDFHEDAKRLQTITFYRALAQTYTNLAQDLEDGLPVKYHLDYKTQTYALHQLKELQFGATCEKHIWSYDKTNYRCVKCASWRQLEPVHVEIPDDVFLHIFSFLKKTPSFCKRLRFKYLYNNAWHIISKNPHYPSLWQMCKVLSGSKVYAKIYFPGTVWRKSLVLTYSANGKREITLSNTKPFIIDQRGSIPCITSFTIGIWTNLNKFTKETELNKYKISLLCREGICKEFRTQVNAPGLLGLAYKEASLYSLGIPLGIVHLISTEDSVVLFERGVKSGRKEVDSVVAGIISALEKKDLLETVYGLMSLWFAKVYDTELAHNLRQQTVTTFT